MLALIVAAGQVAVRARAWWSSADLRRLDTVARAWAAQPRYHCGLPGCPVCTRRIR
ncbi:hypothetical protein GCM10017673_46270 [Streptosporangium violaceochromogenes]|nr:hypothetical protein GCM10017673_46270 [Streptosporangium violaceochromogenes]